MSQSRMFQNYGVGVGLRAPHFTTFLNPETRPKSVQWIEVVSENFMDGPVLANTRSILTLEKLRTDFPISLHGVSLSIGSMHGLDLEYLKKLKALVDRVQPIVVSDHLCWTRVHGIQTHDLNPLPYTNALIEHVATKIKQVQDYLGRRILIENVSSYLTFEQSTMSEEEFVARVIERADCGVLLDINNVYVSSVNHGFDPREFLSRVPHDRVGQMHLAGHTERNGFLIDTHDQPVRDEVWSLFQWYGEKFGHASAMIERDGNIPAWSEVENEVLKMKSMFQARDSVVKSAVEYQLDSKPFQSPVVYSEAQQNAWANSLIGDYEVEGIRNQPPLDAHERFEIYEDAFWIRLNASITEDFVKLHEHYSTKHDEESWDHLVFEALSASPPTSWTIAELGAVFLEGLKKIGFENEDQAGWRLAEQDWARIRARFLTNLAPTGQSDFNGLALLSESDLERVALVLHPSSQVLKAQKCVIWAVGDVVEKHFSSEEWKSMVSVLDEAPMMQIVGQDPGAQARIQDWVKSGLVQGWKLKE